MTKDGENKSDMSSNVVDHVDPASPYYVHPSDYPGQLHVTELLRDGNYADWADEISNFLFAKNKMGIVDGTLPEPEEKSKDYPKWKRCNAMVRGWLTTAMEKEIRNSVKYAKTAQQIWQDLEERFGKEDAPRAYELRRDLSHIRQEGMTVSAYYTKLRGIWDEVQSISPLPKCTCGASKQYLEMKEKEKLYDFLMGLEETHNTVRTQILTTKPTPSLGTAYHLVSEDEKRREIAAARRPGAVEAAAFQTYSHHSQERKENTHYRGSKREKRECRNCGKLNHTIAECFEIIGYPPGWKPSRSREENKNSGYNGRQNNNGGCRPIWDKNRSNTMRNELEKKIPRAAFVDYGPSPIPGMSKEVFAQVAQYLNEERTKTQEREEMPNVNMAGLTFEEPDWSG